jgi:ABC-type amino acid transport substrate-binding protein
MTHRPYLAALLLLALGACEEDSGDTTCTISSTLAGDVTYSLPGPDDVACVTQFSSDSDEFFYGFDVEYATFNERSLRVDLSVDDVTRGLTGDAFPTEVRVHDGDIIVASIDCTVDISEHVLVGPVEFGESWQIRGSGRCNGPLTNEAGKSVTIAPFEFATQITWTN